MSTKLVEQFKAARRVSTPLVVVRTPDPSATIDTLCKATNGSVVVPKLRWNIVQGVTVLGEGDTRQAGLNALREANIEDGSLLTNLVELLDKAVKFPAETILFIENAQRYIDDNLTRTQEVAAVIQGVWNLRDPWKADFRTCVLLCPEIALPVELAQDSIIIDQPYPTATELGEIVDAIFEQAEFPKPDAKVREKAVDALRGVAAYPAETAIAMCLRKDGSLDVPALWSKKVQIVNNTPGLTFLRSEGGFDTLGGMSNLKQYLRDVSGGRERPRVIVIIDEIEKQMAGATGGDLSGTAANQLGQVLSYMDGISGVKKPGIILLGPAGSGKTAIVRAFGAEVDIPVIVFDLGGAKGSLVGQSEARTSTCLKVIDAVGDGRALIFATCNKVSILPPELQRRFMLGTFFVDLPNAEERQSICTVYEKKYELPKQPWPEMPDWTGAEINSCAYKAWALNRTLVDMARTINPVAKAMGDRLVALRSEAEKAGYISASYEGSYRMAGPDKVGPAQLRARGIRKEA